ncbi:uncharacterized protein VTP21DRAFT_8904 [Calcarisporiella thermophila]|uniref:uncharacterized protein n=1 Tax=Calcarisporiella thermophila TaxID=911321 RepID=UPI003743343E
MHSSITRDKPMVEPEVHKYVARNSDQYSSQFRDSYIVLQWHWRKREIQLIPQLADALLQGVPQIEGPYTFPLGKCVLAGTKIKDFRTKIGRLYMTSKGENITPEWKEISSKSISWEVAWMQWKKRPSEPKPRALRWRLLKHRLVTNIITRENITPEWKEISSKSISWEVAWMQWKKRPSEPKPRALRWRLLKHRLVTNIITSKWTGEPNICKRCTTNAVETISQAYLECPAISQLLQTVESYVCRILGVRAHETTKEDRLFGTDYKTMGYQREVVATGHDAAIWIIYRSRLSIIMDNAQPSEIALAEQLGHEMQKIVRSKLWPASIKDEKEDLQELWCKGSWIQVQGDEISFKNT